MIDERIIEAEIEGGRITPIDSDIEASRAEGVDYFSRDEMELTNLLMDLNAIFVILDNTTNAFERFRSVLYPIFDAISRVQILTKGTVNMPVKYYTAERLDRIIKILNERRGQ